MAGPTRVCSACGVEKPLPAFHRTGKGDAREARCGACSVAAKLARYSARKAGERQVAPPIEKRCGACGETKSAAAFRRSWHSDSGLDPRCNPCIAAERRLRSFGITQEDYDALFIRQNGVCAICGCAETSLANHGQSVKALAVDHDHETGAIRGLLCHNCNKGIGHLGDSPNRLLAAAAYLLMQQNVIGAVR